MHRLVKNLSTNFLLVRQTTTPLLGHSALEQQNASVFGTSDNEHDMSSLLLGILAGIIAFRQESIKKMRGFLDACFLVHSKFHMRSFLYKRLKQIFTCLLLARFLCCLNDGLSTRCSCSRCCSAKILFSHPPSLGFERDGWRCRACEIRARATVVARNFPCSEMLA